MDALVLTVVGWAVGYAAVCAWWPYGVCGRCGGAGKFRSPSGRYWRPCGRLRWLRAADPHRPCARRVAPMGRRAQLNSARNQQPTEGEITVGLFDKAKAWATTENKLQDAYDAAGWVDMDNHDEVEM